jgi:DNA-directed RNA polymerase specialized sigma24 family protein
MAPGQASFDAFVNANLNGLLRTAFLISWDPKEAEDLVQECLFKVARHWSRVGSMQQPVAYARRVLINLTLDDAKSRARRSAELYEPTAEIGTDLLEFAPRVASGTRRRPAHVAAEAARRNRAALLP